MTPKPATCDPQQIERLLRDDLDADEQAALEAHLSECSRCRGELERSAADGDHWQAAQEYLDDTLDEEAGRDGSTGPESGAESVEVEAVLAALGPTDDPRMLGRLGGYEIVGVIGRGGMGIVLKGFDAALNRYVAIKVLAPHLASSGAARQRFAREARAAATVVHDNVVAIHGVDGNGRLPYFVMPYIRGCSLQKRIDRDGPLPVADVLRIARQVAAGLAAAHAQGLVHRDIKPANILLEDGVERLAITDFGLARAADDASLTRTGVIAGTPQYMSPEQACGEAIDARSDLFSLGSLIYAMCAGRPPFRAETSYGVLRRIGEGQPRTLREVNPETPDWLALLVERLHHKDPADRIQTAERAAELLEQCLKHWQQPNAAPLPKELRPDDASVKKPSGNSRRVLPLLVAGTIVAIAAVVLLYFFGAFSQRPPKRNRPSAESVAGGEKNTAPAEFGGQSAAAPGAANAQPDTDWDGVAGDIEQLRGDVASLEAKTATLWSNAPASAEEAVDAFKAQVVHVEDAPRPRGTYVAQRQPFAKALERVDDTLTEAERRQCILLGSLDDLRRQSECWAIEPGGPSAVFGGSSLAGYLDAETGRLVFVWLIPEG